MIGKKAQNMNPLDAPGTDAKVAAPSHSLEERALFEQAQRGDFNAFQQLIERWQPRVYTLAYRIVGRKEDAEDITQQTFLSVIEHLDQFRGESAVLTWVLRIATNHALQLLRRSRQYNMLPLEIARDETETTPLPHPEYIACWRDDPEHLAHNAEVRQLIEQALTELDDKYRLVFILRDIEGLSVRETAEALGLSESNVKVRLLRARLQLRERLTRTLGDPTTQVVPDHDHHALGAAAGRPTNTKPPDPAPRPPDPATA
jgi:RNA polymerase sigma-70 factor (ECF subfamily)